MLCPFFVFIIIKSARKVNVICKNFFYMQHFAALWGVIGERRERHETVRRHRRRARAVCRSGLSPRLRADGDEIRRGAALPAIAAHVEPVYAVMYELSPAAAQFFMPVNRTCTENGIRLTVESAYIHGGTAEIYVALTDTEGKGRIDETTDLYDSYYINRSFDSACGCESAGYDEETQTKRFYINIQSMDGSEITGSKITFGFTEFLSGKTVWKKHEIPNVLNNVSTATDTQLTDGLTVLTPGDGTPVVDGIDLTGIGYVNGKLHVQLAMRDILETDNHGFVWLETADGKTIDWNSSDYDMENFHEIDSSGEIRTIYYEFIFDVPQEELGQYTLYGDFWTCSTGATEGNWRVTFPLENAEGG